MSELFCLLAEEEKALKIRANILVIKQKEYIQREKDLEQKQKQRRLLRLEIFNILESLPFITLVGAIVLSLGIFIGINVSDVSGCYKENTLCQIMRLRTKVNY
ncbi:hypothetical protein [Myxosarcina sp. GI1]|uniref:hypothetical protein n=1 Tax=Myxosarcina sp. GI1 TaxID=1541065 RepID=UPI00056019D4|nr:hypothetical protein [Myxosarcina sp. GI1]